MIDVSGWRKRQIALDQKAENVRDLGLDYAWVELTESEIFEAIDLASAIHKLNNNGIYDIRFARCIEDKLREKNT